MTQDKNFALGVLQALNIAVLRRAAPREYLLFGKAPSFYVQLFPSMDDAPCTEPWLYSPMLEFFLEDVEQFFDEGQPGSISSGVWQEDGRAEGNNALIATAMRFDGEEIVIIRKLQDEYADRVGILHKAREQLLENRELAQHLEIFKEKSRFDGLTKIYNRATFMEMLHDEIRRSLTLDHPLSLLLLDIDDFKKINDAYGHPAGDIVLRNLGMLLANTLRRDDIVARYGGEEFVVLVPRETREQARQIGEKLRHKIASMPQQDAPSFTVSIGCTEYVPKETIDSFIKRADMALYDAKRSGKNTTSVR